MIDVVVLFFLLGLFAGLTRSELKLPGALYDSLSLILLLAIGLEGGEPRPALTRIEQAGQRRRLRTQCLGCRHDGLRR